MKKTLYILLICLLSLGASAQDTLATAMMDTTDIPTFFDEALAWLDTTECESDTLIAELPDSIYKVRLQALPFVIEVPYNEVVRRYILRYLKHSPRP